MYSPMLKRSLVGFLLLLSITTPAYAYLDPNAGGVLFQLLTPLLAVAAAAFTYARKQLGRAWLLLAGAVKNRFDRFLRDMGREIE
jgi:lipoprotein signal peptidase